MPTLSFNILVAAAVPDDVLVALEDTPLGDFLGHRCDDPLLLSARLSEKHCDALILDAQASGLSAAMVDTLAADVATLVVAPEATADDLADWFSRGVQDVLAPADLTEEALPRRLLGAIGRHRHEREMRKAYATDLETGLPHQQQLIEHMSHLMALRDREPAPMALLVLRIEGFSTTQARHGTEAAQVLRRKVGVRLRAGVRASDVVASLGDDSYAVLLASMLMPADANRVADKLLAVLKEPVKISGQDVAVAVALGIAQHPQDGNQPDALLRRATGLAASAQAEGRAGLSNFQEAGGAPGAANDE